MINTDKTFYYRIITPEEEFAPHAYAKVLNEYSVRLFIADGRNEHTEGSVIEILEKSGVRFPDSRIKIPNIVRRCFSTANIEAVRFDIEPNFWVKNANYLEDYTLYLPSEKEGDNLVLAAGSMGTGKVAFFQNLKGFGAHSSVAHRVTAPFSHRSRHLGVHFLEENNDIKIRAQRAKLSSHILWLFHRLGATSFDVSEDVLSAFQEAHHQSLQSGVPVRKAQEGRLVDVMPDGTEAFIKPLPLRRKSTNRVFELT